MTLTLDFACGVSVANGTQEQVPSTQLRKLIMRKIILLAVAAFVWKKMQSRTPAAAVERTSEATL